MISIYSSCREKEEKGKERKMDGRGGECCIARYAHGHGSGGAYNHNPKIDRIMLKFRPIAPKPASSGSGCGGSSPEKNDSLLKPTRVKRKYVRGSGAMSGRKRRLVSEERLNHQYHTESVTLPLLPEKPDQKRLSSSFDNHDPTVINEPIYFPIWLKSEERMKRSSDLTILTRPQPVRPVGSCVIVECVTDTCMEDEEVLLMLGSSTDEEKKMSLEKDTCPGFISDGLNRVCWTNEAYRKMVNQDRGHTGTGPEMVWLVVRDEKLPLTTCEAFACRVRVQYTCRKEKSMLTVPCDVWKMRSGGFAWRLDVKAALSLGR